MPEPACDHCSQPCSMDHNDGHGWFCNCVAPCQHADQGTGWYITTRHEKVEQSVEAIYYVWADSPADALSKLNTVPSPDRIERRYRGGHTIVTPESDWGPVSYDFNEGMGR